MLNIETTCMGCFAQNETPQSVCPECGYNEAAQAVKLHQLRPRTILHGKYLLGRVLGEGGFGITYIGWDLNLDLKVAIKEYYPSGFVTRETTSTATVQPYTGSQGDFFLKGRERFINEAKSLARFFSLPGIVSVKDYFQENGTTYITMEYIEGQTLKDYLGQMGGKLPAAQVFELMKPVMTSLAEVHKSGVIHRDISPDNIMISKEGYMKLLDFGAAREFADSGNKSLSIMLKPGFAPEEQYRTKGVQGPWTDVYALSATMYKCITGITPEDSLERIAGDSVKPLRELGIPMTAEQETAIMKGMAVRQADRFQSVMEMHAALYGPQTGIPATMPVSVTPPVVPQPAPVSVAIPVAVMIPKTREPVAVPEPVYATAQAPVVPAKQTSWFVKYKIAAMAIGGVLIATVAAIVLFVWSPWSSDLSDNIDYPKVDLSNLRHLESHLTDEERAYINNADVISIAAVRHKQPISFYNARDEEWRGIAFDILEEIQNLTGLQFQMTVFPYTEWPVLLDMLESGEVSMITDLAPTPDMEGRFLWAVAPYDKLALISKTQHPTIDAAEAGSLLVGLCNNTESAELFEEIYPDHGRLIRYTYPGNMFVALERGDIDIAVDSSKGAWAGFNNLKANVVFDSNVNLRFGFNKDEVILRSIINKALSLLYGGQSDDDAWHKADGSQPAPFVYRQGTLTANRFSSEFLDLSFTAPEGYIMATREQLDTAAGEYADTVYEMMAAAPDDSLSVILMVEKLGPAHSGTTDEEYLDAVKAQLEALDVGYAFTDVLDPRNIAGRTYTILTAITAERIQYFLVSKIEGHMLTFAVACDYELVTEALDFLDRFQPYSAAENSIAGTWITHLDSGASIEFAFSDDGRFYLLHSNDLGFDVSVGSYTVSGNSVHITTVTGYYGDGDVFNELSEQRSGDESFSFSFNGGILTMTDESGITLDFSNEPPIGIWSFEHEENLVSVQTAPEAQAPAPSSSAPESSSSTPSAPPSPSAPAATPQFAAYQEVENSGRGYEHVPDFGALYNVELPTSTLLPSNPTIYSDAFLYTYKYAQARSHVNNYFAFVESLGFGFKESGLTHSTGARYAVYQKNQTCIVLMVSSETTNAFGLGDNVVQLNILTWDAFTGTYPNRVLE